MQVRERERKLRSQQRRPKEAIGYPREDRTKQDRIANNS